MKEMIRVVHSSEVKDYILGLGLSTALGEGRLKCGYCNTIITIENFGGVTRFKGELVLSCDDDVCLTNLATLSSGKLECR